MSAWGSRNFARSSAKTLFLLFLAVIAALPAFAAQDTTPPALTSFTYSPMSVDVTNSSASVSITVQATDDLSGVSFVNVGWVSPTGADGAGATLSFNSGTTLNGTWKGTATVARFVEPGIWNVTYLVMEDNVGNTVYYYPADLQALGFPTTLTVTSNQDTTPPALTSFTYSPMSVDVTNSSASVSITVQATDDLSGVSFVNVGWVSPTGADGAGATLSFNSGTTLNGTWKGTATVARFVEPGIWNVTYLVMEDNVGNTVYYYPADLQALGFPTTLLVVDGSTVVLASTTDPSSYEQPVTFTATVTSSSGVTPTGTINFNDGSTIIGSGTLDASGVTTFTTSALALGNHTIVASYLGDANNSAADSGPLIQTVNQAATTTTIASSRNPSKAGHPVTFTASVSFINGLPPNGDSVEFFDGQGKLGTTNLNNGSATITTSRLAAGIHQIWAKYLGDANLQTSKSAPIRQGVKP